MGLIFNIVISILAAVLPANAAEPLERQFRDAVTGASFSIPFNSTIEYKTENFQKYSYGDNEFALSIYSNANPKKKNYSEKDMYRFIEDRSFGTLIETRSLKVPHQEVKAYLFQKDPAYHLVSLIPTYHSATYVIETRLESSGFISPEIIENGTYEHHIFGNRFSRSFPWWVFVIYLLVVLGAFWIGDSHPFTWFWTIVLVIALVAISSLVYLYFTGTVEYLVVFLLGLIGLLVSPSKDLRAFITNLLKEQ